MSIMTVIRKASIFIFRALKKIPKIEWIGKSSGGHVEPTNSLMTK